MRTVNVVLAHHDPTEAQGLSEALRPNFRKLVVVSTASEARAAIARFRAGFVIVDLELLSCAELQKLCREFPATVFACVHRLADEIMWSEVLSVGAVDCCLSSDVHGILQASERYLPARASVA